MNLPDTKDNVRNEDSDLVTRSYSPNLRVLVVAALFIVAVFLLASCGSKARTAVVPTSKPTQSTAGTPSASTSGTSSWKGNTEKTSDSNNKGTDVGKNLEEAKKEEKRADVM